MQRSKITSCAIDKSDYSRLIQNPPKLFIESKNEVLAATNCSKDLKRKMSLSEDDKSKSGEVKIL